MDDYYDRYDKAFRNGKRSKSKGFEIAKLLQTVAAIVAIIMACLDPDFQLRALSCYQYLCSVVCQYSFCGSPTEPQANESSRRRKKKPAKGPNGSNKCPEPVEYSESDSSSTQSTETTESGDTQESLQPDNPHELCAPDQSSAFEEEDKTSTIKSSKK